MLIKEFGDYHRLFWNCQVFAKCFLYLITGEKEFDRFIQRMRWNSDRRWTSADATQLFLYAFIVTLPTATTMKLAYEAKRKALGNRMEDFLAQIEQASRENGMHRLSWQF